MRVSLTIDTCIKSYYKVVRRRIFLLKFHVFDICLGEHGMSLLHIVEIGLAIIVLGLVIAITGWIIKPFQKERIQGNDAVHWEVDKNFETE